MRRSHHEHRLAVVGRSREELCSGLEAFARGEPTTSVATGRARVEGQVKVALVFSGQGSQWAGMGRALLEQEPAFRASIEACEALVQRHAGFSLLEALLAPEQASRLHETSVAQPALFAIQVALSALWRSWGILPDAVIGHSVGEVAAAHIAGALGLEEAVRLVCLRGRIMQQATGSGGMVSVALGVEEATRAIAGHEGRLAVAAINEPGFVVLSGEEEALSEVTSRLSEQGVRCRSLRVEYAFHSPRMAPLGRELTSALGRAPVGRAALAMYSTVTGERASGDRLDASYWGSNVREPVLFARALQAAVADGHRIFVEMSPHPVLTGSIHRCFAAWGAERQAIPTLRRGQEERRCLLQALGALYAHGYAVDFERLHPEGGRVVELPTYPWQRQRYWVGSVGARLEPDAATTAAAAAKGVGARAEPGPPELIARLEQAASPARRAILAEHVQRELDRALGLGPSQHAQAQRGFFELGVDSLMALALKDRLEQSLGRPLPATLLFDHPTVEALTGYLAGEVISPGAPQAEEMGPEGRAEMIEQVAQLSEDEMSALIDHELSSLR